MHPKKRGLREKETEKGPVYRFTKIIIIKVIIKEEIS